MMGVSPRSVYGYIQRGKLLSVRVGTSISVLASSAQTYQRSGVGRPRSRVPIWRVPVERNLQYLWIITACFKQGQREHLAQRLAEIRVDKRHLLPGTVARYVVQDETNPELVRCVLVWRQTATPPEAERDAAIAAWKADLADLIAWETACTTRGLVVMNA